MIGERIDVVGCSNLMCGWAETGFRNEELFEVLAKIVVDKSKVQAFFSKGDANAIVNIIKSMFDLDMENDEFLNVMLEHLVDNFDELTLSWAVTLLKTLGSVSLGS